MKNTARYPKRSDTARLAITQQFPRLIQLKQDENPEDFTDLFLEILPEMKRYVRRRLDAAVHKGHFPHSKYKPEDFTDQLMIDVYDEIYEVKDKDDFYGWLFKKTNQLLDNVIFEEEFEDRFFKNIDDYSKKEWDALTERFSVQADGDLVLKQELDDVSYHKSKYQLGHIFTDDSEKTLVERLDKELTEEDIHHHIEMVLQNLPRAMETVFELFTEQSFTIAEIADIMGREIEEVEQLLKDARKGIYRSLFNRHLA